MAINKTDFLKEQGLLNPNPRRVSDPQFHQAGFFDPLDLPQVRYEMLRAARVGKSAVSEACKQYGFSREYFYKLERSFIERGYVALLGTSMGRPPLLALNQDIINFIIHEKLRIPSLSAEQLREKILQGFKVDSSRRTVERLIETLGLNIKGGH